jgi:hypothetical protein
MAFPVPPNDPNTPIPNDPFYYPQQNNLQSDFGPLIIGTGLNIDYATGILSANDPGTPAGVTALLAGDGIFLNANTGVVTVSNTGVTDIVAGIGISVSHVGGTYTITNITQGGGTGTVTQINTGGGLTGGPITGVGTISMAQSGVAAATYTNPTITVDQYGRITFATSGASAGAFPVQAQYPLQSDGLLPSTLSIAAASTSARGSVQLNDTVTSTSTNQAATARAVKQAYDASTTATTTANTALGVANSAQTDATAALSAAATAQTQAATALGCSTTAINTANGAVTTANNAQTTATQALGIATTACSTANSALASANVRIPCSAFLDIGDILIGCGAGHWQAIPVGTEGQVLTVCNVCPSGVTWAGGPDEGSVTLIETGTGLLGGPITSVGTIFIAPTGVTPGFYANASLEVNAEGQITSITGGGSPPVLGVTGTFPIQISIDNDVVNVSVASATGANEGVVRLYNALDSTSSLLALTAQQGKVLQDQITQVCADKVSSVSGVSPISVTAGINPAVSIANGTTTTKGAVQLYDALDSTSTTLALTANQGKVLQDQINSLSVLSDLTFAGTINADTGLMVSVSASGTAAGFAVGQPLPLPGTGNANYFAIVEVSGTFTPTGGSSPVTATQGDWVLSDGADWQVINIGFDSPYATDSTPGLIQLSTDAETQAGLEETHAVTPANLQSKVSDSVALTSSTTIASSTAVKSAYDIGAAAVPKSIVDLAGKGSLLTSTGPGNVTALPLGTNGYVLKADASAPTGICWGPALTSSGVAAGSYTTAAITVNECGIITSASSGVNPVTCQNFATKGDLLLGIGVNAFTNLGVGGNGQILRVNSSCSTGVEWGTLTNIVCCSEYTNKGVILVASGPSNPTALPAGLNGYVLTADSTAPEGVVWAPPEAPEPVYAWMTLNENVLVSASIGGGVGIIPFTNAQILNGIDWNASEPTRVCALSDGMYSWTIDVSYCWDVGVPNQITAHVYASRSSSGFSGDAFASGAFTGGETGFSSLSFSGLTCLRAGQFMEFALGLDYAGCLYSPGSTPIGSNRASLTMNRIDNV